jgi:hypothetical protein
LRLPITGVINKFVLKAKTLDTILAVVAWSLRCLACGTLPTARHDGGPWLPTDSVRRRQAGLPLGCRGVLAEVRGDWVFYKQCFRFPQHNEREGCCWRCRITPSQLREVGASASWRSQRLGHWDLVRRMQERGIPLSPLLSAPCLRSSCFQLDWLHVADLGVTCDFLGNLFRLLLAKLEGDSEASRCRALFLEIQAYYRRVQPESRLDDLRPSMLGPAGKPPKLRAKAAEARFLVPFAKEAAERLLAQEARGLLPQVAHVQEATARQAACHLAACYDCLSQATYSPEALRENSRKFALLYVALERATPHPAWRVKPKLHLFQEMCELGTACPSLCWSYRDEDFGGSLAQVSRRRGGSSSPAATAAALLAKFAAKHEVPGCR